MGATVQWLVEARAEGNIEWQFQGRSNIVGYHNGKVDVAARNSLVNIAEKKTIAQYIAATIAEKAITAKTKIK